MPRKIILSVLSSLLFALSAQGQDQTIQGYPQYQQPAAQPYQQPYGQPQAPIYPQGAQYAPPVDQSAGQPPSPYGGTQAVPQYPPATNVMPGMPPQPSEQWSGQAPVVVPPISFIDINSGRFGKLEINLFDGQFMDGAVDNLNLVAKKLDLTQGQLASLDINIRGGHFQDFTIDQLNLSTQGALNFDTGTLLNHRMLQFGTPALAQVTAVISQNSLNRFLNSPQTLNRLSVTASKKAAILTSLLGPNANVGLQVVEANLALEPNNRLLLNVQTKLGLGGMGVAIPLQLDGKLDLLNGWVHMSDTRVIASGQEISPDLSQAVVNKVNSLSSWGSKSDDIHFSFTSLQVLPNDKFVLRGTAEVMRLRFGRTPG